jgi:hypothetical protein
MRKMNGIGKEKNLTRPNSPPTMESDGDDTRKSSRR